MIAVINFTMIAFGVMIVVFSAVIVGMIIGMIHEYNEERAKRKRYDDDKDPM